MSSGFLVGRLTEPFGKKPCSRGGRPSRTPPSVRRGTASPPPAWPGAHAAPRRRGAAAEDHGWE